MPKRIRVLVIDDSLTVRQRLVEVLSGDPDFEVIGDAEDGKRAIELCRELRPDVITLDMMMPVMSGPAAVEYIMAHFPTPILIVSSSTNRGELFKMYDALAAGAVDVLEKPTGDDSSGTWERDFLSRVKLVSKIKVITHVRARLHPSQPAPSPELPVKPAAPRKLRVVAIGASTGGPRAVVEVLRSLPYPFPVPILIVIHIGKAFGASLADWLDAETAHSVSCARDGESLENAAGRVLIAQPDVHMAVRGGRIHFTNDPARHSCIPSVDVLFESVAETFGSAGAGCLLTGMGRDGAAGMLAMRQRGAMTIAEDESTCVVYGMPREAVLLNAAEQVLPLGEIGHALTRLALNNRGAMP
jgi:two-component system chemotaxis response regulator CheB